jgi:membrane associated rhomboid family serine protease
MLVPIAHENATVKQQPWMTFAIIAACLAAFLATGVARADRSAATTTALAEAIGYFLERPYLRPDPALLPEQTLRILDLPRQRRTARAEAEQAELDRLTRVWLGRASDDPMWRWGLVPAGPTRPLRYISSAFLHGGWLHLLGNMLFLYLAGPFVEERWGRWRFLALYLGAAVVSAAAFAIHFPYLNRPLVGASGAVAAVMGGFVVHFWHQRIRFLFAPLFPLPPYWRFGMRALVVVPLWFGLNLLGAARADAALPGMGTGVAYDAHIAGFAFGVLAALVARAVGSKVDGPADPNVATLAAAQAALASGQLDRAQMLASGLLRFDATRDAAALLLWSLARRRGEAVEAARLFEGVIRRELREGQETLALTHWRELVAAAPGFEVDPALSLALLQVADRQRNGPELERMLKLTFERLPERAAIGSVLQMLRLAARQSPLPAAAAAVVSRLLARPDLGPAERAALQQLVPAEGATEAATKLRAEGATEGAPSRFRSWL